MLKCNALTQDGHALEGQSSASARRVRGFLAPLLGTIGSVGVACAIAMPTAHAQTERASLEHKVRALVAPSFGKDDVVTLRFDERNTNLLGIECVEVYQVEPGGIDADGNFVGSTSRRTWTVAVDMCAARVFKLRGFAVPTEFNSAVAQRSAIVTERDAYRRAEAYVRLTGEPNPRPLPFPEAFWQEFEELFWFEPTTHVSQLRNYYRVWEPVILKNRLRQFERRDGDSFVVLRIIARSEAWSMDDKRLVASVVVMRVQPDGSVAVIDDQPFLTVASSRKKKGISTVVREPALTYESRH